MPASVKSSQTILGHDVDSYTWFGNSHYTFLLIHGIGVSHRYFIPLADELSKRHTVIAIDLPGYGSTDDPDGTLSIDELAHVVHEFSHVKQLRNVILVGHSMGTQIVVRTLRRSTDQYEGFVLLAPTIDARQRNIPVQFFRLLVDSCREPLQLNKIIFSDYLKMGIKRYLKTLHYMINDSIEKTLEGIELPCLVVGGKRDAIAPYPWVEQLSGRHSSANMAVIENAPHNFQFTHHKETAVLCERFVQSLER